MCCILCCCCDTCNIYSSKCIELFIFMISLISFGLTIFIFFSVNVKHITLICYIIIIALMVFSFLILMCIGLIVIWRYRKMITKTRIKVAESFSIVGLVITIFYLICIVSLVSMMYTHYEELNHPCLIESESKDDLCIDNPDYNVHEVSLLEYIIPFSVSGVVFIFNFLLIYLWFNDYRRIKFLIEGSLNDFDAQEIKNERNKDKENENSFDKGVNERINRRQNNQNNKYLYKIYSQQENGIRYDIYGRPIIKANKSNFNTANTKDNLSSVNTQHYLKRKNILNNRVSVYIKRNSIKPGGIIDALHSNSSERNAINKIQFSRMKTNNNITIKKVKA